MKNKIIDIMNENKGIITPNQLEEKGISRVYLSKLENDGVIDKIERGIYVTKDFIYDDYYIFQLKYPKAIFSYNTALYLHGMTERTPVKMDISIPKNYNPHPFIEYVNVYRANEDIYKIGITEVKTPQGMTVKAYELERTICDIIKNSENIDIETRNKAIKKAIKSSNFNASKMFEYADKLNIYDKVKSYMEAII